MSLETWLLYLLAATGLSLSPGPNSLLALTHGALYGWRPTLATIAGGAFGFVALIALSLFGIGALLASSPVWLQALQRSGGGYLAWLGVQVWRAPPIRLHLGAPADPVSPWTLWRQGLLAATAHRFSGWLGRVGRTFNRACGALFIAIGVLLPLRG
jgi:threonine/homoserine/homoserine lactone efflux protein